MIIKPPNRIPRKIFLAGTIDMGNSVDWQAEISKEFPDDIILNPRRDDWNSKERQSIDNEYFNSQVNWEMNAMEKADLIIFNFLPNSQSPITIGEFYYWVNRKEKKILTCCPDEFWRSGNIHVMSERYDRGVFKNMDDLILEAKNPFYFH